MRQLILTIAFLAGTASAGLAEDPMTILNCTQTDVKLLFFNNNDTFMTIPKKKVNIDAGLTTQLNVPGTGVSKIRVYDRGPIDKIVLTQTGLGHTNSYYLTARGGVWELRQSAERCSQEFLKE